MTSKELKRRLAMHLDKIHAAFLIIEDHLEQARYCADELKERSNQ